MSSSNKTKKPSPKTVEKNSNLQLRIQLARRLQELMGESGLSQRALAELLHVGQPRIAEIMSLKVEYFSVDTLLKYLEALGDKIIISTTPAKSTSGALALFQSWVEEESSYDEEVWPLLKNGIEENRLSERKRFSQMNRVILLDSGPLGMVCHPKANQSIITWFSERLKAKSDIRIPEISDYEVRRKLIRANLTTSIARLDKLQSNLQQPLNTETMHLAAALWADMRKQGQPTADDKALDGDVILAAQTILLARTGLKVIVATANVAHLSLMVSAEKWEKILD